MKGMYRCINELLFGSIVFLSMTWQPAEMLYAQMSRQNIPPSDGNPLPETSDKGACYAIAVDKDGNVYVAGTGEAQWGSPVHEYSGGAGDCLVARLNDRGDLLWHTFLGGTGSDGCRAIAVDDGGHVYVTGESASAWTESIRTYGGGSSDCFVAKLDNKGAVLWNTSLGGPLYDGGYSLAVDSYENVFIVGNSVETWGSPIISHTGGNHDGFAARLDKNGKLLWNTFFGSDDYDGCYSVSVDESGNVYVTGESFSEWGAPIHGFVRGYYGDYDAYVAKLDPHGSMRWNTFIGGTGSDYGRGITLDTEGNVYVTGKSNVSWGTPLAPHSGDYDAYAAKLDGKGELLWHTFLGGEGRDSGSAVIINWTGNIFVTGQSLSSWGKPVQESAGESDAFAVKLDSKGIMQWNTFLGGEGSDSGHAVTMDVIGNIYLAGEGASPREKLEITRNGQEIQAFVAKLSNAGDLRWKNAMGE